MHAWALPYLFLRFWACLLLGLLCKDLGFEEEVLGSSLAILWYISNWEKANRRRVCILHVIFPLYVFQHAYILNSFFFFSSYSFVSHLSLVCQYILKLRFSLKVTIVADPKIELESIFQVPKPGSIFQKTWCQVANMQRLLIECIILVVYLIFVLECKNLCYFANFILFVYFVHLHIRIYLLCFSVAGIIKLDPLW